MTFLRKSLGVLTGQSLAVPLGTLTGVVYARALGPQGMGQYELFRSTALIATTMLALGLGNATIFLLNKERVSIEQVIGTSLKTGIVLGAILGMALMAVVFACRDYFGVISVLGALFFSAGVAANLVKVILRPALVAQLAARRLVFADLGELLLVLGAGVLLGVSGLLTPTTALVALAGGFAGGMLLLLWYLRPHIRLAVPFDWHLLRRLVIYGLKLAAANVMYVLCNNLTVLILRHLRPDQFDAIGLYTRAVSVAGLVLLVPTAMGSLLYAKWSLMTGPIRIRQAEQVLRLNMLYALLAALALLLVGRQLLWTLYGPQFTAAHAALQILGFSLVFVTVMGPLYQLLASDGRAGLMAVVLVASVFVVGVVTWVAVPKLGIRGAALGALCSNLCSSVGTVLICRHLYGLRPSHCLLARLSDFRQLAESIRRRPVAPPLATSNSATAS